MRTAVPRHITSLLLAMATLVGTVSLPAPGQVPSVAQASTSGFVPLSPARALDTRVTGGLGPGAMRTVSLSAWLPPSATSVVLNVTGTRPTTATFITVWPTGGARPGSSNVNLQAGQTRPNSVIVGLGADLSISLYNDQGNVDVLLDVMGYFTHGFTGIQPVRAMDTRTNLGGTRLGPGSVRELQVRNVHDIPSQAVAVAVNVTATRPTADTFITVWPSGGRPNSSNLNVRAGSSVPNLVVVGVGGDDRIRLYSDQGQVDLLVDVMGWFDASGGLVPQDPVRALDTRSGSCALRLGPGQTRVVQLTDRTDRSAAVVNVTATGATEPTFLTVWPTGGNRPGTSNVNVAAADATPNLVMVGLGTQGQISIYNDRGSTNVLVDVFALTEGPTPTGLVAPCPVVAPPGGAVNDLLVRPALHRMVGHDRVAVWVCNVPASSTNPWYVGAGRQSVTAAAAAQWANQHVSPYFASVSNGRYTVSFEAAGNFSIATDGGPRQCIDGASTRTGAPFTNAFAVDDTTVGHGLGGPGRIASDPANNPDRLQLPPNQTRRGFWIGGDSVVNLASPAIAIHEVGHTLHWPHSGLVDDYDNTFDIMSGDPDAGWCERQEGSWTTSWPCVAQHTLAFNRLAAGWIDDQQLRVHPGGTSTVTLAPPAAGGIQLVAAPLASDKRVMLTAEARPRVGHDIYLDKEGVALHVVDQRPGACPFGSMMEACLSTERYHAPALGPSGSTAHVLGVGESRTVYGVTVVVEARVGDSYRITLSGSFTPPSAFSYQLVAPPAGRITEIDGDQIRVLLPR